MLFVYYPKCSTCQRAKKWLEEKQIIFEARDVKLQNPTKEELIEWHQRSGLPLKKFFNTSGNLYKQFSLKDRLETMSDDEKLDLLSKHGMLIKRPLLVSNSFILIGFKEKEWNERLCQNNMK